MSAILTVKASNCITNGRLTHLVPLWRHVKPVDQCDIQIICI